ncbi:MAG: galactose mutarotase [Ruminococcaceae bacterium]|nr:galactose mutarotase [Oscillospiraceae bacterium]
MNIEKRPFGEVCGKQVDIYTMTVDSGASVSIITFGGAVNKLLMPDREGKLADVVCGYDDLKSYTEAAGYQGALIGRVGNRIGKGRFTLDGKQYQLYINNGENSLHGGKVGFSHKVWDAEANVCGDACVLDLYYTSPDGEENYPGTLKLHVTYKLTQDNALSITYRAETDKKTIINLTNHTYFNLAGFASGKIFDHEMWMDADSFIPTDKGLIPTGEIRAVDGTPFDFREAKKIGRDFDLSYEPMAIAGGYDHCMNFVKREQPMGAPRIVVSEQSSGRVMEVYTTEPCVQFYSGNFLNSAQYPFKGGYPQGLQNAFCLETQRMPDSINHENFTDCTLDAGEKFESTTIYKFSVK